VQQTGRRDSTRRLERFEDLAVWRRAHELTPYESTARWSAHGTFGAKDEQAGTA